MKIGDYAGISTGYQSSASKSGKYTNVREEQFEKLELKGKDLEDLTNQFAGKLSIQAEKPTSEGFDVKA